jgi:hypothetical protein
VRLREDYEADRKALVECNRLDEGGDWVYRAAALGQYAEEVNDQRWRPWRSGSGRSTSGGRGELLRQMEPEPEARSDLGREPTRGSRAQAVADAGFSPHQDMQAMRAAVPAAVFERQVEARRRRPSPSLPRREAGGRGRDARLHRQRSGPSSTSRPAGRRR